MNTPDKNAVLIVEDHEIFRLGIRELINHEPDLAVCGEADDVESARTLIRKLRPDLVIIDITLKKSNGMDLIKEISAHYKSMKTLVLSMHDELLYAERSLQAGAQGYIMKQETSRSIVKAIRHILAGNIYVSQEIMDNLLERVRTGQDSLEKPPVDNLSDRELEVLGMIGQGKSTGDIAANMNLSVSTISTYRERIKEKLNLKNAAELVRYAVHWVERQ
ncbi:MAG TPA: response regulator transcription factor [Deltaproteobacteria bacterium]|jgi:DNA-binding NarL/FixJ family response regulator|nr:response regulator transcription factor [Deltaproteobacteria bacterium]HOY75828.1 response regulator transcription factor [Deltaproteobacteria bacterium]HPO33747.1 response regulator transcription factor [Deltaproteobacteria bacterium]HQM73061.1 response regulator transcription factor [Deltaproteobacteria bacterium]HUM20920.1 response regulator transcription factor [Deltaproteobacteria bacterium]